MADKKVIKYGDKTLDMPDGMTLDQAKVQMARFFPELAEPEIKTEKKDDKTVYVFSKKAGRKGGDLPEDEMALLEIACNDGVGGIMLWVVSTPDGPQFLGSLIDNHAKQIAGSTLWSPKFDLGEAIKSLVDVANNYAASQK